MTRYIGIPIAYNAWFQCINGCPGEFDLREVIYRCPTYGDLLEVQHSSIAGRGGTSGALACTFEYQAIRLAHDDTFA